MTKAVSPVTRMRLTNIQKRATIRPQNVIGTLSPYPTATVVTPDHQNPEPRPASVPPENCGLRRRSRSQMAAPARNVSAVIAA